MPLDNIMNCKKIKDLTTDKAKVLEAIKEADSLEINKTKDAIRRKGNKPLPELTLRKRGRREEEFKITDGVSKHDLTDP